MGIAAFSVTYARKQVVDFTEIFSNEHAALLIPPPMEENRLIACAKPFQILVWLGLFLSMILVAIIMWFLTKIIERYRPYRHYQYRPSSNLVLLVQQFQSVYAVSVSQCKYSDLVNGNNQYKPHKKRVVFKINLQQSQDFYIPAARQIQ
jgi:hypothetical protein